MDALFKNLYEENRRVYSPWYPDYALIRAILPIWDGEKRTDIKGMIQAINDERGTPQNTRGWDDPDQWIPERLPSQYQDIAKKIWAGTENKVNPRYTEGLLKFITRYGLLSLNSEEIYEMTERGEEFLKENNQLIYHIDELEGVIKLLQIISDRQPVKRAEIHIDWNEYLIKFSNFGSENTIQHTYNERRKNLLARGFITEENNNEYRLTDLGEKYLSAAKSVVQQPMEIGQDSGIAVHEIFKDPDRQFWLVGASWDGDDQTERFVDKGIWQNGYEAGGEYSELVESMKPGDKIAIKSAFTQKNDLPFDINGGTASRMKIKAIGTITKSTEDGRTVDVSWTKCSPEKDWYFYTNQKTVWLLDRNSDYARKLIVFTFSDSHQDYRYWLEQPYWLKKYKLKNQGGNQNAVESEISALEDEEINTAESPNYTIEDIISEGCFVPGKKLDSILRKIKSKKNIILQGPPGTGKTWLAKKLGYALLGSKSDTVTSQRIKVVQFHPSMSYEDFVRGYRPTSEGKLELKDGILMEAIEAAKSMEGMPYILVIEEINRGNPAQIFGEMLTLLEDTKRKASEAIYLAYTSKDHVPVYIPPNLHIIGTMNVADRSLAIVDFALRRRFAFINLEPNFNTEWKSWCQNRHNMDSHMIDVISEEMNRLNNEISNDHTLGKEYCIGHSYVMPKEGEKIDNVVDWFSEKIESEIYPLLDEYWHGSEDNKAEKAKESLLQAIKYA